MKENNFIYIFLTVLGLHCCTVFSLVAESGGHSPVVVCSLLTAVASLVVEHGPYAGFISCSSWALTHRLNS